MINGSIGYPYNIDGFPLATGLLCSIQPEHQTMEALAIE